MHGSWTQPQAARPCRPWRLLCCKKLGSSPGGWMVRRAQTVRQHRQHKLCLTFACASKHPVFVLTAAQQGNSTPHLQHAPRTKPLGAGRFNFKPHTPETAACRAQVDVVKLKRFLCRVESGYASSPYHSSRHAADVLQVGDRGTRGEGLSGSGVKVLELGDSTLHTAIVWPRPRGRLS